MAGAKRWRNDKRLQEESKNEMDDRMARAALLFFPSTLPPRVKHLVPLSDPPHDTVIRVIMYQ